MNILARAPSPPYVQVAEGTFTQANARLSLVDGTAFFDCGADLSAYAGLDSGSHEYYLKVYSKSNGASIGGYVGAGGLGELLVDIIEEDCTDDDTGDWSISDCTLNFVAANGDVAHYTIDYASFTQNVRWLIVENRGTLWKGTIAIRQGTASTTVGLQLDGDVAPNTTFLNKNTTAEWVSHTGYGVSTANTVIRHVLNITANLSSGNVKIKDILLQEIADCAATGFHIISAQGGSTQNWQNVSASFNYNDTAGYGYKIYRIAI